MAECGEIYSIGIDVGGTNTDAVFLRPGEDGIAVLAKVKTATTQDVVSGIREALGQLLARGLPKERVRHVFLGTTKFLNALLERQDLLKVGVVRLCLPTTVNHPPLIEWPKGLRDAVLRGSWLIQGGYEFFPEKEISALADEDFVQVAPPPPPPPPAAPGSPLP